MDPAQDVAIATVRSASEDLIQALRAVPAHRRSWRPGGVANHAVGIVAHCTVSCRFFAAVFGGSPIPFRTQAERDAAIAGIETAEQAEKVLADAAAELCAAIARLGASRLGELMIMPWGERMPYARGIMVPALHIQYHAGQINYIQCLLGDDEHH